MNREEEREIEEAKRLAQRLVDDAIEKFRIAMCEVLDEPESSDVESSDVSTPGISRVDIDDMSLDELRDYAHWQQDYIKSIDIRNVNDDTEYLAEKLNKVGFLLFGDDFDLDTIEDRIVEMMEERKTSGG
jgi:hypothetical protein